MVSNNITCTFDFSNASSQIDIGRSNRMEFRVFYVCIRFCCKLLKKEGTLMLENVLVIHKNVQLKAYLPRKSNLIAYERA